MPRLSNTEVLEWIASQMRGKRNGNRTLMAMVATIVGAAALPLAQLPNVFDIGMYDIPTHSWGLTTAGYFPRRFLL